MNPGKEAQVRALFVAWRKAGPLLAREQWRLFFDGGDFNPLDAASTGSQWLGTAHRQMVRHQVVGVLRSFISNRQNDFRRMAESDALYPKEPGAPDVHAKLRHHLHFINRTGQWFSRKRVFLQVRVKGAEGKSTWVDGEQTPDSAVRLARVLMKRVLSRCRRPTVSRLNLVIDQRMLSLAPAKKGPFALWARLSTLEPGQPIHIPLVSHQHFENRHGNRALTLQSNDTRHGIRFGILTDVQSTMAASKAAYVPRIDAIGLDLGLSTLFATSEGDLLGRGWMPRLRAYDARITKLAAYRQSHKLRTSSERYRRYVRRLRGCVESEVNRILNRLVEAHSPKAIVIEHLSFQNANLSRRLNRLLSVMGKGAVTAKLKDLEERLGIQIIEAPAPYTSQTCHSCGYTDARNRPEQKDFTCLWCHHHPHADVNAARNILSRRSWPKAQASRSYRSALLSRLVRQHAERYDRPRGGPADPRSTNPYFKDGWKEVTSTNVRC